MPKTIYRILTLGKSGVGKTSLLESMVYGRVFKTRPPPPTIEDIYECTIETEHGSKERVHIYDTSGQSGVMDDKMKQRYFSSADGIVLVYSCNNCRESFTYIKDMRQQIEAMRGEHMPMVVVGTTMDSGREDNGESRSVAIWAHTQSLQHYRVALEKRLAISEPFVWIMSRIAAGGKRFLPRKN
ncbi:NF-kappa-B inhibitor-interacting Ras-like protein 1 [Corticium candelabrum]|uniref:NF-kappa-B inhibitor-interacting Ras-like protein 1 n=1 Tax=Corticium candelabrum TaxID=121492 RepID=UPI002E273013|nr:NF-kappa-B inhibitor-interacting Ras-like protein 1 [Corticium candelabrum]